MKYIEATFHINPFSQTASDLLAALLADVGFETFTDTEDGLVAYIQQPLWNEQQTQHALLSFPMPDIQIRFTSQDAPYQDWNQVWEEEGFQPVIIANQIVVHDTRHTDVPHLPYDICISPRQSFGTGNHNTTRMIMEWLLEEDLRGKDVIDAGTGTGVLSIMSILRGARHVLAYDIDEWSVDNAKDNLLLNGMGSAQVEVRLGNASVLKEDDQADLLMANINRNILLADMQTFASAIDKRNGRLLLSGFYQEDIPLLLQAATSNHLHLVEQKTDDNWAMLVFAKNISSDSQNKA